MAWSKELDQEQGMGFEPAWFKSSDRIKAGWTNEAHTGNAVCVAVCRWGTIQPAYEGEDPGDDTCKQQ